jgi:hypothetical protein
MTAAMVDEGSWKTRCTVTNYSFRIEGVEKTKSAKEEHILEPQRIIVPTQGSRSDLNFILPSVLSISFIRDKRGSER